MFFCKSGARLLANVSRPKPVKGCQCTPVKTAKSYTINEVATSVGLRRSRSHIFCCYDATAAVASQQQRPVWARGRCRISPPRFLAECCKRQLNQVSLVLLYFRLSTFSDLCWVCLSVFSCTVLFVSISQVIGCENRLRNDLYCVEWGVKPTGAEP